MILKFEDVESIEFKRYETTGAANLMRNFDLAITMKTSGVKGEAREFSFNLIDRAEYKSLLDFLSSKKLTIKNPIVSQSSFFLWSSFYSFLYSLLYSLLYSFECSL